MASHWKSALDPGTGKTYFYNDITRATQWRKPAELATDEEKLAIKKKEQKEKDFFAAMEANILSSLSRGVIPGTPVQDMSSAVTKEETGLSFRNPSIAKSEIETSVLVRTISTMNETVLTDMIQRQPSIRSMTPGYTSRETSLQLADIFSDGRTPRSNTIRDGFDSSFSNSLQLSHSSLPTWEEGAGETSASAPLDSMPDLLTRFPAEGPSLDLQDAKDEDGETSKNDMTKQSLKESQAMNKLIDLTQEMIDLNKEGLLSTSSKRTIVEKTKNDQTKRAEPERRTSNHSRSSVRLLQVTERDSRRTLPREINFEDSDDKEEKPASFSKPRREKAARMLANSGISAADLLPSRMQRRNSCGTMYIKTTLSSPDKDTTIKVRI